MARIAFKILEMDCQEEIRALRQVLDPLPGVEALAFDLLNVKLTVDYDDTRVTPEALRQAIARTGMKAEDFENPRHRGQKNPSARTQKESGRLRRRSRTTLTLISGGLLAAGFAFDVVARGWIAALDLQPADASSDLASPPSVTNRLYVLAIAMAMALVIPRAWFALRRLRPDMNLLMTIAVMGALFIGAKLEAATVAFLFALSLALESWSVARARRAVAALMDLSPPKARILCPRDGREEIVDVARVAVGTTVIVLPGEKIPLDGRLLRGETAIDQSPLTGESLPVARRPGDEVFAGTINGDGAIEIVITRPADDTTLARVIRMVEEARGRRAPSERWVDRFAAVYTPVVMALACAVALLPPLLFAVARGEWGDWLYRGLVLLVIACPCALVISTPVAIVAALTAAARRGVLVKGGRFIEMPSRLRAIAFDKTGTLTRGHPEAREVVALDNHTPDALLRVAAALDSRSEHPIARAIVREARARGLDYVPAENLVAVPGKGARGRVAGRDFWIGSHRYMRELGLESPEAMAALQRLASARTTVVAIGTSDHVCGFVTVADRVRDEAARAVAELRAAGIERLVMLTGDNRETGEAVARETGLDAALTELLPGDKMAAVESLVADYVDVAMVGDGVNDAPAMARAPLAIAMGAIGTDAALETADITLMSDDLARLPWLVHHSRRTLGIIRVNIALSLGIKVLFVALAFAGTATLWAAIAADMGVSLVVIANALRLLHDPA